MKKYLFGLALFAGLALTSCNTDNEGALYHPSVQNVSFEASAPAQITVSSSSTEIPVRLVRAQTTDAYTAHYTLTDPKGIFTDANGGQVTFEKGMAEAIVTLKANNMEIGNAYSATLQLSEADKAQADTLTNSAIAKTTISVMCDYNWISVGKGHYDSPEWWEDSYDVDIVLAEGTSPKLYKIIGLFEAGYDIKFTISDDNKVNVPAQASWKHSSYGVVTLVGNADDKAAGYAGLYDPATKKATFTLKHTVSAGSFGTFTDVLTMP